MNALSHNFSPAIRPTVRNAARPWQLLSFAGSGSLWSPFRSGDYARDCLTGRAYAREMVDMIAASGALPTMGHIAEAMAGAEWGGVEIGFFQELAELSVGNTTHGSISSQVPLPTGNFAEDCAAGRTFAGDTINRAYIKGALFGVGRTARSMIDSEWTGVQVGFFHELAAAACRSAAPIRFILIA